MKGAYPLDWPAGWKRSHAWVISVGKPDWQPRSMTESLRELDRVLSAIGGRDALLSTNLAGRRRDNGLPLANQAQPKDRGAALRFTMGGELREIATDAWQRVEDNIWALAQTLAALRAPDRYHVGTMAHFFNGYRVQSRRQEQQQEQRQAPPPPPPPKQPPPPVKRPWWEVLEARKARKAV